MTGEALFNESEVLKVRTSKSRPSGGLIKMGTSRLNQDGEAVQVLRQIQAPLENTPSEKEDKP